MATSPPDDSGHGVATSDLPHASPGPDVSQDEVTPASLSYDLLGLSLSIGPEPPSQSLEHFSQSLEHFLSSIEDDNDQAPEHDVARARHSVQGHLRATLPRPQVENELGTIPELLEDPGDSPVSASEVIKDTNLGESSETPNTSDLTAVGFSGRTGPRYPHILPHSSDQVSIKSMQTFETALSSIGSYMTASSGPRAVSRLGRWTASNTEEWIAQYNPLSCTLSWQRRDIFSAYATCEPLVSNIERIHGGLSIDSRDALRNELLPLFDRSWSSSTSVKSYLTGLVSRIEQICSSYPVHGTEQNGSICPVAIDKKVFTEKVEQLILEYTAMQPHIVRDVLSIHEPFGSQWLQLLKAQSLILDPKEALDWSGRGQHVEYSLEEQEHIPLVAKGNLGFGASGIVDRVRCRRIDLARKTIRCNRTLTREEAAKEVRHLQQLQHRHVVRLVGTYMLKKNLSILMYPATEYSLDGFLDKVHDELSCLQDPEILRYSWCSRLLRLIACLINAIVFIHAQNTKHMDIKPSNILVGVSTRESWAKVYITDFGIARSYQSREEAFTDSPISYTRIYTAPEVAQQTTRGPPADIFSLGCVFLEILATLLSTEGCCQQERLRLVRHSGTENSYQANITNVIGWYESVKEVPELCLCHLGRQCYHRWAHILPGMLSIRPEDRPTAVELKQHTQDFACRLCDAGPEPFEAAT